MQYQQGPPQQVVVKQKKDRGCLGVWYVLLRKSSVSTQHKPQKHVHMPFQCYLLTCSTLRPMTPICHPLKQSLETPPTCLMWQISSWNQTDHASHHSLATLCCCFVAEEGCECCADCCECAGGTYYSPELPRDLKSCK